MVLKRLLTLAFSGTALLASACNDDPASADDGLLTDGATTTTTTTTTGVDPTTGGVDESTGDSSSSGDPTTDSGEGGDCCAAHANPGCDDSACQAAVCAVDKVCCALEWDNGCAEIAEMECGACGGEETNSGGAVCGDGTIESPEVCEGDDLGGADCASLDFEGGTLGCDDRCQYDTSGCSNALTCDVASLADCTDEDPVSCTCEACDAGGGCQITEDCVCPDCAKDAFCGNPANCNNDGACTPYLEGCGCADCAAHPLCAPAVCGDDAATGREECDGTDLVGADCISLGFASGVLACDDACAYDTSGCVPAVCGDGTAEGPEACDGADLAGADCASLGFTGGDLACDDACAYDTSGCTGIAFACDVVAIAGCTDEDPATCTCEACDPGNGCELTEDCVCPDCVTDAFCGGPAACNNDGTCSPFAEGCACADCFGHPLCTPAVCGDDTATGTEECDGADLAGSDCTSLGFASGVLACDDACTFDTSGCIPAVCGDGAAEGPEACDGDDLAGADCISLGFTGGDLACDAACAFDTSGCTGIAFTCDVVAITGCIDEDPATCTCQACDAGNGCELTEDCVCPDCAADAFCSSPASCNFNGICDPFNEGCACTDCAGHPLCP